MADIASEIVGLFRILELSIVVLLAMLPNDRINPLEVRQCHRRSPCMTTTFHNVHEPRGRLGLEDIQQFFDFVGQMIPINEDDNEPEDDDEIGVTLAFEGSFLGWNTDRNPKSEINPAQLDEICSSILSFASRSLDKQRSRSEQQAPHEVERADRAAHAREGPAPPS